MNTRDGAREENLLNAIRASMPIPTREEWKALVAEHGYHRACELIDCDLDDVPGIEDTWIENFDAMKEDFARSERAFWKRYGQRILNK